MPISWHIETHESLESTQKTLKILADSGAAEGICVQAARQTGGYGRHGRGWISPAGNLYISILLRPVCPALRVHEVSLLAGVAVCRAIRSFMDAPEQACLKWPNDVLIAGKKCAGLLIESALQQSQVDYVLLGAGINVANAPEGMGAALQDFSAKPVDPGDVRDVLLAEIHALYSKWPAKGFGEIRKKWVSLAHPAGTVLKIKLGETMVEGYFQGLDENGNLLLEKTDGDVCVINTGDVYIN